MKNKIKIEEEVQKTMKVLDQLERVEGNPFFMGRLEARLQRENATPTRSQWQLVPVLQVAAVALLLIVNVLSFSNMMSSDTTDASLSEVLADEYGWETPDNTLNFYSR